ncbi:MAG: hypothetical protein KME16_17420 [Scytolyngbya sp. HA4215-MV1]|jgi:hypothetical protein|nr:hypothetical protein [Scytolyngbya sp. HA4215-MV1]
MPSARVFWLLSKKQLIDAGLLILLALLTVAVTVLYTSQEQNFYWWVDWYNRTVLIADLWRDSPRTALLQVQISLTWERNSLFTLPLLPFLLTFGNSRPVYETGLVLIYLLPFSLAMGALATRLILAPARPVFWSTALLTLLVPVTWSATLLGIPDTGGATFLALAGWVYLKEKSLKSWRRAIVIGALLAAAILLRRHFVYGAIAGLTAMLLSAIVPFWQASRHDLRLARRHFLHHLLQVGLITLTCLVLLLVIAWGFTTKALTHNYDDLYASWSLPLSDITERYLRYYGWATWAIVFAGLVVGTVTRRLSRSALLFVVIWGGMALVEWLIVLRYGNVFYSLHITPVIVLGLAAFFWTVWGSLAHKPQKLALGLASVFLGLNLIFGLTPLGRFTPAVPWFALSMPPLVKTDYQETVRLIDYLRQLAPDQEPIYVLGIQRLQLTPSLIGSGERYLYGNSGSYLNLLATPQVDSQDFYPLEPLLKSRYVVVPDPLPVYPGSVTKVPVVGEWLLPQEHDVAWVVADAFKQNWQIAQDFRRLPSQFHFENGTQISIYERTRPTPLPVAVKTLAAMGQRIGTRPGGQPDWISLSPSFGQTLVNNYSGTSYRLVSFPSRGGDNAAAFLYVGRLSKEMRVTGLLDLWSEPCVAASIQFQFLDHQGNPVGRATRLPTPTGLIKFSQALKSDRADYLLLKVFSTANTNEGMSYCTVDINRLSVSERSS